MADSPAAVSWNVERDGILRITLQRPPANPLGLAVIEGLGAALDAAQDRDCRVLVVTSDVPGFFAAGADIKHMSTIDSASFTTYGDKLRAVLDRIAGPRWVTVAAVEGLALGGGLELAMACTLRVAGRAARFGLPEVKLGLIPGAGGTQRLPRLIGRGRALDMMLTGRQVAADEAFAMGLVDRLVDDGRVIDTALTLAGQLRQVSLPAQQAVMRAVDAAFNLPWTRARCTRRRRVSKCSTTARAVRELPRSSRSGRRSSPDPARRRPLLATAVLARAMKPATEETCT
jgi:enoyl-CoA hydratase/carnithine racemase